MCLPSLRTKTPFLSYLGVMMTDLDSLKDQVREAVHETAWDEYEYAEEDLIHELVDSATPIYNGEILEVAKNNPELATTKPEILAHDGSTTGINCITGRIFEELEAVAWEEYNSLSD